MARFLELQMARFLLLQMARFLLLQMARFFELYMDKLARFLVRADSILWPYYFTE